MFEVTVYGQPIIFFESISSYMSPTIQIQTDGMHLFWNICNFELNLLLDLGWGTRLSKCNRNGAGVTKQPVRWGGDKNLFFLYRNLRLLLNLPLTLQKEFHPMSKKICHCVIFLNMCISSYLISSLLAWLS